MQEAFEKVREFPVTSSGISYSFLECEYTKMNCISLDFYIIILPLPIVYCVINLKPLNFSLAVLNTCDAVISRKSGNEMCHVGAGK